MPPSSPWLRMRSAFPWLLPFYTHYYLFPIPPVPAVSLTAWHFRCVSPYPATHNFSSPPFCSAILSLNPYPFPRLDADELSRSTRIFFQPRFQFMSSMFLSFQFSFRIQSTLTKLLLIPASLLRPSFFRHSHISLPEPRADDYIVLAPFLSDPSHPRESMSLLLSTAT